MKGRKSPDKVADLRRRYGEIAAMLCGGDLRKLARVYGSDKWGGHSYAKHYQHHFSSMRNRPLVLIEIGIGGYSNPRAGGGSLRMWRKYFPNGRIYGIDIEDKHPHNERRIRTFRGDQSDEQFLRRVLDETGPPNIVIDDGSHINKHVIKTFEVLFPELTDGGIYAVEDTQTAYWPEYGGSSDERDAPTTSMHMLKRLADGLNHQELTRPGFEPSYFDRHVVALHFYHNLAIVLKGTNDEPGSPLRQMADSQRTPRD
jgi:hypothetical protein